MKIVGIALMVLGLFVGYTGIRKLSNNTNQVKVLGLEIDASNEKGQTRGILYIVGALALIGGGVYMMKNTQKA